MLNMLQRLQIFSTKLSTGSTIAALNHSFHFRLMWNHDILNLQQILTLQMKKLRQNSFFAGPNMKACHFTRCVLNTTVTVVNDMRGMLKVVGQHHPCGTVFSSNPWTQHEVENIWFIKKLWTFAKEYPCLFRMLFYNRLEKNQVTNVFWIGCGKCCLKQDHLFRDLEYGIKKKKIKIRKLDNHLLLLCFDIDAYGSVSFQNLQNLTLNYHLN